jgi:protocatechuate 3,4-dioxygenase beta subunit
MNRQKFLSLIGLSFLGTFFFSAKQKESVISKTDCDDPITPPVPEGPFYKNEKLNRIEITEHKKGVPVEYVFKVEDKHCNPIAGAIVDIWQCDADGVYSDFKQENTESQTWLRGYQVTDKHGECRFTSIFPGWYAGRITHLHAKVHSNDTNLLTTNLFFQKDIENEVYKNPLYTKGPNPISILNDIELKVDKDTSRHDSLVMNVTKDGNGKLTGRYKFAIV